MFAFILYSEYATSCFMAKSVVTSKQDKQFIVLFCHFIQPSKCKYVYVLFVCLSVSVQVSFILLHFRYFGQTFSFNTVDLPGKSNCATHSMIFAERIEIIFCGHC